MFNKTVLFFNIFNFKLANSINEKVVGIFILIAGYFTVLTVIPHYIITVQLQFKEKPYKHKVLR